MIAIGEAAAYDAFAACYARWWGPECADGSVQALDALLLGDLPAGSRVLDLCCGSGDVAARLLARGLAVTGVDSSARLLQVARQRAPTATFVLADARSFHLAVPHDAAISVFDSLNHMRSVDDLDAAFRQVHAALRPGAPFICDLNTEAAYLEQWDDRFGHADEDLACVVTVGYDRALRTGSFDAVIFQRRPDGLWDRSAVVLRQTAYEPDQVTGALERAGFGEIEVLDAAALPGMSSSLGRAVYVCRRPTAA